jgi:hypothetical protein
MISSQIDDRPPVRLGGSMSSNRLGNGGSMGSTVKLDAPGKHEFKLTFELAAALGAIPTDAEKANPRWAKRVTLARPFEIVPPGAPDYVEWTDDPSLEPAIRKAISLSSVRASGKAFDAFAMTVQVAKPPANIAFEIFARDAAGKEYPVGQVTAFAGESRNVGVTAREFPPGPNVGKVDVIFRSSERGMRGTTDIYEAWRGEIRFDGVAVTADKN